MVTRVSAQAAGKKVAKTVQKNVTRAVSGTLGLSGERMSKVDTAWLRMDTPSNLMMIVGVWSLQPGVSFAAVAERLENSLLKYSRFKQRVIEDAAGATWVDDRNFDLKNHLIAEKLPKAVKGHEQAVLQDRAAAGPKTPALANSSGRGPHRPGRCQGQRHDCAYPPLHCRRHCPDHGDHVAGGRRRIAA
jgi:hypothetical protein